MIERAASPDELGFAQGGTGRAGAFRYRAWHEAGYHTGLEIGGAQVIVATGHPFFVGVQQGTSLRVFGSHGVAFGYFYEMFAGAELGVLRPEVRVGMSTLTLDVFRGGLSAELFSPRATAGASIRLARGISVGAFAYGDYLWRWFGPDVQSWGASLELRVEGPHYAVFP